MSAYLRGWRPTQFAGLHFITVTEVGRGCGCEQSLGAALTVLAVKRTRSHRKATRSQRVAREAHFGGRREGGRGTSRLEMSMLMFAPTRDQSAHVGGQVRVRRRELELRRRVRWVRLERRHLGDGVRSRNRRGRAERGSGTITAARVGQFSGPPARVRKPAAPPQSELPTCPACGCAYIIRRGTQRLLHSARGDPRCERDGRTGHVTTTS